MVPDPGDDDEEAGGEVVGHHVEAHLPGQHQLETYECYHTVKVTEAKFNCVLQSYRVILSKYTYLFVV